MFHMPYRWELLFWLWLAFFLNQASRQVFNVVLPLVQSNLGLTDVQAGLVASIFIATVGLSVPVAGYLGDIFSRKWIVVSSVVVWSGATLLTGFSTGLLYLVVVRSIATAGGEAFYAPSANALISEYHLETRAQAMAIHQTALYAGIIASGWLAGYLGQQFGWRSAFWLFGAAGLVIGGTIGCRLQPEPPVPPRARSHPFSVLMTLVRRPTVLLLALGFACMVFVNVGYLTWAPTFLYQRFGLSLANAGFSSMFYHHLGAFFGVLAGGHLSDLLARGRPVFRLELQAAALLMGSPFIYMIGRDQRLPAVYMAMAGFGFFRGIYDANIYAALYEVIEPRFHASAAAVIIVFAFTAGAFAPVALGGAKELIGLGSGLAWLAPVYLIAGTSIFVAAQWFFQKDREGVSIYAGTCHHRTT